MSTPSPQPRPFATSRPGWRGMSIPPEGWPTALPRMPPTQIASTTGQDGCVPNSWKTRPPVCHASRRPRPARRDAALYPTVHCAAIRALDGTAPGSPRKAGDPPHRDDQRDPVQGKSAGIFAAAINQTGDRPMVAPHHMPPGIFCRCNAPARHDPKRGEYEV